MKLLIVDDHEVVRKGLMVTLGYEIKELSSFEAATIEEAIEVLKREEIEFVLLDVNLAGTNGLDLVEQCQEEGIKTEFIILTSSSRKGDYIRARELGVSGYILKDSSIEDISYAIRTIQKGRSFFDSQLQEHNEPDKRNQVKEILTDREFEILREIGQGLTNSQIAEKLFITENTVKKHISSILGKMELSNRTEVALLATNLWRRKDD
ncbi:MAG: response regulator [Cellulosilyticaceae bacterium]